MWTYQQGVREAGYQTALFGKWHLLTPPDTDVALPLIGQGRYWNPIFIGPNGKEEEHQGYVAAVITDMGIDWLKHRDKSSPSCWPCSTSRRTARGCRPRVIMAG